MVNADRAGVTPEHLRDRQRQIIGAYLERPQSALAAVILGTSDEAVAMRNIGRRLLENHARIRHPATIADGCRWMKERTGVSERLIMDAYHHLVSLHAGPPRV